MAAKILNIGGLESINEGVRLAQLTVYVSNDKRGKTISVSNGEKMFTFPFEPLAKYLK